MDYSPVLDLINTQSQANELVHQLDGLIESLYEIKGSVEAKMNKVLTQELKEALLKVCQKNKVSFSKALEFQKFLEGLKTEIQKLPVANFSFAFEPTGEMIKKIAIWVSTNLKQKILIAMEVNPKIIGGLLIEFNGNYKDYSLRSKINTDFERIYTDIREKMLKTSENH